MAEQITVSVDSDTEDFQARQTRLPSLGEQWEMKQLGDICSIRNQKVLPLNIDPDALCVELDHIGQNNGQLLKYSTAQNSTSHKYLFFAGDILFGRLRSYLRKFWHSDQDGICTTEIWPLAVRPEMVDSGFLYAIVQSDQFIDASSISYGTHMPRSDWNVMRNFEVALPPLTEQRAIAEVLSDVDGLIQSLDELIAKKRVIKQAAMQQLLTGKTRLPGFDGEWETRRLGDIGMFLPTANNPRADFDENGEVRYVHYGDIHAHPLPVLNCATNNLPRIQESRVGKATRLQDGDLVMVDASEDLEALGKSVEVMGVGGDNIVAGLHTILYRGNSDHWAAGFKAYLQYISAFKSALVRIATGISVYAISKKQLADIVLALPPPSEQEAIVSILSDMDAEIVALERQFEKIRVIKQGAMQQLLTGRIRLIDSS